MVRNPASLLLAAVLVFSYGWAPRSLAQESSESAGTDELKTELIEAVQGRDLATVQRIMTTRPDLASSRYGPGIPLLLIAAFTKGEKGFVRTEDNELVALILPHIKEQGIFEACIAGNVERVRELAERQPSIVDTAAASGWTPMHFAAFSGSVELVDYLHAHGADIHARAWKSSSIVPLLSALLVGRYDTAKRLLDLGADPLVRERGGFSAMHEAANLGDTAMIRLLYERGAELNSRRDTGERPIDLAAKYDFQAAVSLLRELGADE